MKKTDEEKYVVLEITVKGLSGSRLGLLRNALLNLFSGWGFKGGDFSIMAEEKTEKELIEELED